MSDDLIGTREQVQSFADRIADLEAQLAEAQKKCAVMRDIGAKHLLEADEAQADRDAAVAAALEEAAKVADAAYKEAERTGLLHPEDSESRGRLFARAREASYIASEIRALIPQSGGDALKRAQADRDAAVAAALEEAASRFDEIAEHDYSGIQYSELVGIPISNREELEASVREAEANADAIRALIPQSGADALERARAVAVKPLVWKKVVDTRRGSFERRKWDAVTDFGVVYSIWDYDFINWRGGDPASNARSGEERYSLNMDGSTRLHQSHHPTLEAAKAAAQADYEKRIRSALVHVTPDMLAQARADGMRDAGLIAQMQDACRNYLEPTAYIRRSAGGTCKHDSLADMPCEYSSADSELAHDIRRDRMFISDIIYFLDSEEHGTNTYHSEATPAILAAIEKGEG